MASSEDRQFFEDLNKDLANSLNDAISSAFSDFGKAFGDSASQSISSAISKGFEESGSGKSGDKKEKDRGGFDKLSSALGRFGKAFGTLKAIARPLDGASSQIKQFGNTMARTVAQTGNHALVNARLQKGAMTELNKLNVGSLAQTISGEFADFGIGLGQTGQILDTALRTNAKVNDKGTQEFLARAVGLGNNLGLATQAIATNTNYLGLSTDASDNFNQRLKSKTAKANGRLADTIFQAVEAFKENTRSQNIVFGTQFAGTMRSVVAGLQAAMPDTGIIDAVGKITGTDFKQQQATAALLARLNVGATTQELSQDPAAVLAKMFKAIEADLGRFQNDPRAMASQMELMASQAGLSKSDIEAILTQSAGKSTGELEKIMRNQAGQKLPTREELKGEQTVVGGLSVDAAEAMKDAKIAIQGADVAFNMLSTTTEVVRTSLDAFDGALAKVMGTMAGMSTGVQMGAQATGVMGMVSSLADITSIAADISRFRRGGGFGKIGNVAKNMFSRVRGAPRAGVQGFKGLLGGAGEAVGTGPAMAGAGGSRFLGVATPFTKTGREIMKARSLTSGGLKGGLKGISKKIPLLGSVIAGGF